MQIKQFEYVREIANCNSISKAAQNLFISQQTLSEALKLLETELGFKIFTRSNKGVTPTKSGEKFLQDLDRIMPIVYGWKELDETNHNSVKIFVQSILSELLSTSDLVLRVENVFNSTIQWETATQKDIFSQLEQEPLSIGLLHLAGFVRQQQQLQVLQENKDFVAHPICIDNMMIVLRADDPLSDKSYLKPKDLFKKTIIHNHNFSVSPNIQRILQYTQQEGYYLPQTMDVLTYILQHQNTFSYMPEAILKRNHLVENKKIITRYLESDLNQYIYLLYRKENATKYRAIVHEIGRFFTEV